jgi:hypothetical protein
VKEPLPEEHGDEIPASDLAVAGPSTPGFFSPFLFRGAMFPARGINQMRGVRPPRPLSEEE